MFCFKCFFLLICLVLYDCFYEKGFEEPCCLPQTVLNCVFAVGFYATLLLPVLYNYNLSCLS